jgi:hypothetical protein
MAAMTLPLIFCAFSMNSERRLRTTSSTPPISPALTMLTKRRLKTLGCWARASEKVLPPSMETARSPRMPLRLAFFLLLLQHAQAAQQRQAGLHQRGQLPGEGGQDLGFDAAAQAGDFDLKIEVDAALFARLGRGFLGRARPGRPLSSTTLVGKKPISLMRRWLRSGWRPRGCPWFPCPASPWRHS